MEAEDSDGDEDDFDFSEVAKAAVQKASLKVAASAAARCDLGEFSLNVDVDPEKLYFAREGSGPRHLETAVMPNEFRLDARDFSNVSPCAPPRRAPAAPEVRGAEVRPVDDAKLQRKERRQRREERLEKWYGLRKRELTPELKQELMALKLRANVNPKRFFKSNDSDKLPKYFAIATEVGGGLAPAGEKATQGEVTAKSGRSFLSSLLRDAQVQEWTWKRDQEAQAKATASLNSGHGKRNKGPHRSTRRGIPWKKRRRG